MSEGKLTKRTSKGSLSVQKDMSFPLPQSQMPAAWSDDVRMTVLFAPFRLKSVNPTDYESKMKFWIDVIGKWSQNNGSFSYEDLRTAFQRNGKYPACLEIVLNQMKTSGLVAPRSSLGPGAPGWLGWGLRLALRPTSWATGALLGPAKLNTQEKFIHLEAVKTQALAFLASIPDEARIGSAEELKAAAGSCSSWSESGDMLHLTLDWLQSQGLATRSQDGKLFKLALDASTRVRPLTEGEVCLPRLERAGRKLDASIANMRDRCAFLRSAAKDCLARGDRTQALAHLRQKKLLEARTDKALNSRDSITHLVDTVRQAHSDSEIFNALKTGVGALKMTMAQTGLEEDNVLDTMDDIKESLDTYSDIEAAISQPMGVSFDTAELEDELRELMAAESGAGGGGGGGRGGLDSSQEEDLFPGLPEVPTSPVLKQYDGDKKNNVPDKSAKKSLEEEDFHQVMETRLKNLRLAQTS